ncbi:MAG: helix-turn-helix domain-containing protein [Bacillota bacterium]
MMEVLMLRDLEDVEFICKILYETVQLPVFFISREGEVMKKFPMDFSLNPIYAENKEIYQLLQLQEDAPEVPVLKSTRFLEQVITIKMGNGSQYSGNLVIGPSIYSDLSEEVFTGLYNDLALDIPHKELRAYYRKVPRISKVQQLHVAILAYFLIYHKKIDITEVLQQLEVVKMENMMQEPVDLHVSKSRQEIAFHASVMFEKKLFHAVQDGRKEDILKHLNSPVVGKLGVLSKSSQLRSEKNLFISAITLATRAAMEGGLQPELAYTMSDMYIQSAEDLKNVSEVKTLLNSALCTFADRVHESNLNKYSKPIMACQTYIYKHLYEEITLSQLAELVCMHPNYLSSLFRKEVGISMSEYIQKEKVEEAIKLLTLSSYTLTEIYSWLNFHDQSHFTKIFKKFTGHTPKQYRILYQVVK